MISNDLLGSNPVSFFLNNDNVSLVAQMYLMGLKTDKNDTPVSPNMSGLADANRLDGWTAYRFSEIYASHAVHSTTGNEKIRLHAKTHILRCLVPLCFLRGFLIL